MSISVQERTEAELARPPKADEADMNASAGELVKAQPYTGHLAIRPGQKKLTPEQDAVFSAIVNFGPDDETAWPHINVFLHICQVRGLDPWAKQIYLIKRGGSNGSKASYTVQTGIDGYRFLADRTGRTIGGAKIYWAGAADDERSWTKTVDPDTGDVVMQPVWWARWPKDRGNPEAAKAVLKYYTARGELVVTEAIAHWGMYAPYTQKWEGPRGKRQPVKGADGQIVMELTNDMWRRDGGAHMLGKCAEAAVIRRAFPAEVAGIFVDEEMAQADVHTPEDLARARREAFEHDQQTKAEHARTHTHTGARTHADIIDGEVIEDAQDAQDAQDALDAHTPTPEPVTGAQRRAWLLEEIEEIAKIRDRPVAEITKTFAARLNVATLEQADPDDLLGMLGPWRQIVVDSLRQQGRDAEADIYAEAGSELVAPAHILFGRPNPEEPEEGPDAGPVHAGPVHAGPLHAAPEHAAPEHAEPEPPAHEDPDVREPE